jgi:hypothetical protein
LISGTKFLNELRLVASAAEAHALLIQFEEELDDSGEAALPSKANR